MLREKPQAVEEPVDSISFFVLRNVYGIDFFVLVIIEVWSG
jgi:hypothetical protein